MWVKIDICIEIDFFYEIMSCWKCDCFNKRVCGLSCGNGEIDLSTQAFGLPPKTIRAILAFIIVIATFLSFIGAVATFAIAGKYNLLLGVLTAMTNIMSACLGFYFGSRGSSKESKHPPINNDREMATFESSGD